MNRVVLSPNQIVSRIDPGPLGSTIVSIAGPAVRLARFVRVDGVCQRRRQESSHASRPSSSRLRRAATGGSSSKHGQGS